MVEFSQNRARRGALVLALLATWALAGPAQAQEPLGPGPSTLFSADPEGEPEEAPAPEPPARVTPAPKAPTAAREASRGQRPAASAPSPAARERFLRLTARAQTRLQALLDHPRMGRARTFMAWIDSEGVRNPALATVLGLIVLLFALPALRGRGDLVVCLDYPDELRGTFRVRAVKRRPRKARKATSTSRSNGDGPDTAVALPPAPSHDRAAGKTDHPMVTRETRFHKLPARAWWIVVEGVLRDPDSDEALEYRYSEQRVRMRRSRTARLTLDFRPNECPVDVKVLWDKRPVREARVAVHGVPGSARFARNGTVRMQLGKGSHLLVVGCGDRVAEQSVDVASFRPAWSVVDLTEGDDLLFTGCEAAVDPYLQGDLPGAARALQRQGQERVAHLILARSDRDQGRYESAAQQFEAAGELMQAAELWASVEDFERAGELFDRAGEPERAGEMYRAAGATGRAGEAYERAEDWARAIECYGEAGDNARVMTVLERQGAHFEAAELALEECDWSRAIRNLQLVAAGHVRYIDACAHLGHAYEQIGEHEQAISKYEEVVRAHGPGSAPLDTHRRLAEALEHVGETERALAIYEGIQERDPEHPNVAARIEALRKKRSTDRKTTQIGPPGGRRGEELGSGRYELMEEIGRGGMGVVYKARDQRLGRVVALKRLPENLRDHAKAVELFLREARAAAALNHPNIVTLFDADQDDGVFFFTMELLEGHSLYGLLKRVGKVKPRDGARLGVQICSGLQYAHDRRIIHRDIKTGNFFFTHDKVVKIMDFGLAKMLEEVRRAQTVIAGTPYYMAPEQSAGEAVDHLADLYALGVTFFEVLTGRLPFEEGDVAYQHRHTPPPDPREHNEDLPEPLARLVLDLMEKEPGARPGSASEVSARLQQFLRDDKSGDK